MIRTAIVALVVMFVAHLLLQEDIRVAVPSADAQTYELPSQLQSEVICENGQCFIASPAGSVSVANDCPNGQCAYPVNLGAVAANGVTQRAAVYAADSQAVWLASGGSDVYRYSVRSADGTVRYRSGVASQVLRGSRPMRTLLSRVGQRACGTVSAVGRRVRAGLCGR